AGGRVVAVGQKGGNRRTQFGGRDLGVGRRGETQRRDGQERQNWQHGVVLLMWRWQLGLSIPATIERAVVGATHPCGALDEEGIEPLIHRRRGGGKSGRE